MNVNAVIRASLFFTISITLGEICNIHQTVLCVFLGPAIISGHKFSSRVSTVFIARIFGTVVLGNLVGEVFYTKPVIWDSDQRTTILGATYLHQIPIQNISLHFTDFSLLLRLYQHNQRCISGEYDI